MTPYLYKPREKERIEQGAGANGAPRRGSALTFGKDHQNGCLELMPKLTTEQKAKVAELEVRHDLWRGHGVVMRNRDTQQSLLLMAPPKSGKSSVARRLLEMGHWELMLNDFLEWTSKDSVLYGGLRFSNAPAIFWHRDEKGEKIQYADWVDKREWSRIATVCSFASQPSTSGVQVMDGVTGDTFCGVLKTGGGANGRWKSISEGLPTSAWQGLTRTVYLPCKLNHDVFAKTAHLIDDTFDRTIMRTEAVTLQIQSLNILYTELANIIAKPSASPNGGPATSLGTTEGTEGPPSVS